MTTRMTKGVVPPKVISDLVKLLLPLKPSRRKPVMLKSNSMPTAACYEQSHRLTVNGRLVFEARKKKEECRKQTESHWAIGRLRGRRNIDGATRKILWRCTS